MLPQWMADWIEDHFGAIRNLALYWYDHIDKLANDYYVKLVVYARDWYSVLLLLIWNRRDQTTNVLVDWYSLIRQLVQDLINGIITLVVTLFNNIIALVQTYFSGLISLVTTLYSGILALVRTWFDYIIVLVRDIFNGLVSLVKTYFEGIVTLVSVLFNHIIALVQTWFNNIILLVQTLFHNIIALVQTWFDRIIALVETWFDGIVALVDTLFDGIVALVKTWFDGIMTLVQTIFGQLLALATTFFSALADLAQNIYPAIVDFFGDLAGAVFGALEAYVWPWAEWFLAVLIWPDGVELPPRPVIGSSDGATPGGIPGGPGPGGSGLIWPCSGRRISQRFVPGVHQAIDIAIPTGSPLWSIREGTVVATAYDSTGYGHRVDISHTGGWWSRYGHMSAIYVRPGQHVNQGQTFGLSDDTGNSTGPHVHLEIKHNGAYVNPLQVLPP